MYKAIANLYRWGAIGNNELKSAVEKGLISPEEYKALRGEEYLCSST